jgi:hypothetical protein
MRAADPRAAVKAILGALDVTTAGGRKLAD